MAQPNPSALLVLKQLALGMRPACLQPSASWALTPPQTEDELLPRALTVTLSCLGKMSSSQRR